MKFVTIIFLFFCLTSLIGQDVTFVSNFEVVEVEKGVFVNWQIDSGYTCQGVDILRSTNGHDFEEIGHISGVCGSLSKPTSYSYFDDSPILNYTNFYRLKINGFGFTEILNVYYLKVPSSGVLIYPNPTDGANINAKFDNPNGEQTVVQVLNFEGQLVLERTTNLNEIYLGVGDLQKGIYFVKILMESEEDQIVSKLILY